MNEFKNLYENKTNENSTQYDTMISHLENFKKE